MSRIPADDGTDEIPGSPRLSLAQSLDGQNMSSLSVKRTIRVFIDEYSSLESLKSCSRIYLTQQRTWNRCEVILCDSCRKLRANRAAAQLRQLAEGYPTMISMRTSLSTCASLSLSEIWDGLDATTKTFVGGRWLTRRVAAFRRHTEISKPDTGWNPHHHWVLVDNKPMTESKFENLKAELAGRHAAAAASAGFISDPEGIHFERVTRTPGKFISYITKGPMKRHDGSRTAGSILYDVALRDNAEAGADWLELEQASVGRTWQATGGAWRNKSTPKAEIEKRESRPWVIDDILDSSLDPVVTKESSPSPRAPRENRSARDREHLHGLYEGVRSASTQYEVYLAMKAEEKRAYDGEQARLDFWRTHHRAPVIAWNGTLS